MSLALVHYRELHYDFENGFCKIDWRAFNTKYFLFAKMIAGGMKFRAFNNYALLHHHMKVKSTLSCDPHTALLIAFSKLMPVVAIKNVKMRKFSFRIPVPISFRRRLSFAHK